MFPTVKVHTGKDPRPGDLKMILEAFEKKPADQGVSVSYQIDYTTLNLGKELGKGSFGVVYKGNYQFGGIVAIKQLYPNNLGQESDEEFNREALMMSQLHHPNIIHFYGYCSIPKCLVMEYMPKGSLFDVLQDKKQALDWGVRMRIAIDMVSGLAFLHSKGILHRDIKSLNVLLDEHDKAKLTDFGLSRVKNATKSRTASHKMIGTLPWMAPELFKQRSTYTQKSDIYSLGVTFWELASRKIPYAEDAAEAIPTFVREGAREDIPEDCPQNFAYLIQQCWSGNPDARPETSEIAQFLTGNAKSFQETPSKSPLLLSSALTSPYQNNNLIAPPHGIMQDAYVKKRGSQQLDLTGKKEEHEKIRYVLNALRAFFLEERDEGEKTENYALYNEYLDKLHCEASLVYKTTQKKHILYINDEPLDAETAAKEISKMLKSLGPIPPVSQSSPSVNTSDLEGKSLIEAIQKNNVAVVSGLLALKTDRFGNRIVDEADAVCEGSAIYWAAYYGHVHLIAPLVQAGANVNKPDKDGKTAVYVAAQNGHAKAITELKAARADVSAGERFLKPTYIAAHNGHAEAITALHIAGANLNTPHECTPMFIAAKRGHAEVIIALHAAGIKVNDTLLEGQTLIGIAAQNGHAKAITALHAIGADVNTPNRIGGTPLASAAATGNLAVITALLAAKANVNSPSKDMYGHGDSTPIYDAAQNGHATVITALYAAGANVNTSVRREYKGEDTPIHIAAENGHAAAVTALLDAHADVNALIRSNGYMPIHSASKGKGGHESVIAVLLRAGANVNTPTRDHYKYTPIYIAAENGHAATIATLLAAGADAAVNCDRNQSPIAIAAINGHTEAITTLLDAGVDASSLKNGIPYREGRSTYEVQKILEKHFAQYPNGIKPVAKALPKTLFRTKG